MLTAPPSWLKRLLRRLWWLHSFFALSFGVGVMLFARAGLGHADKILVALLASWLLMFVALRFIVGPANRREQEGLTRKGVRVATNYLIEQFYQQMFFFLTPLYASSATWSFASLNWWIAPLLLVCAVISTMDLVFDHFIMERRLLASAMYGLAMFGVLNVMLPLVGGFDHLERPGGRRVRDAGVDRAALVLGEAGALAAGGAAHGDADGGAFRPGLVRPRAHPAGAARDAGDLRGPRPGEQPLRVPAAEQARDPRAPARPAPLRLAAPRARRGEGVGRARVDARRAGDRSARAGAHGVRRQGSGVRQLRHAGADPAGSDRDVGVHDAHDRRSAPSGFASSR